MAHRAKNSHCVRLRRDKDVRRRGIDRWCWSIAFVRIAHLALHDARRRQMLCDADAHFERPANRRAGWRIQRRLRDSLLVEFGYRTSDVTGSGDMYDTLVNLQDRPAISSIRRFRCNRSTTRVCCSTIFTSTAWDGEAIRTTTCGFARTRTSGTTCKAVSAAIRIFRITTCWPIR